LETSLAVAQEHDYTAVMRNRHVELAIPIHVSAVTISKKYTDRAQTPRTYWSSGFAPSRPQ
jgi:hypothetical protein